MVFEEPKVEFVPIDLSDAILTESTTCTNCAKDDGKYTGGTEACWGIMEVSDCDNEEFKLLS